MRTQLFSLFAGSLFAFMGCSSSATGSSEVASVGQQEIGKSTFAANKPVINNQTPLLLQFRHVVRSATMTVRVQNVTKAEASATDAINAAGGYVESASSTDLAGQHPEVKLKLRVPVDAFEDSMQSLAALGTLQAKAVSSEDVTEQIVDMEQRLKTLRAKESALRGMMGKRGSVAEMQTVFSDLTSVREQIEQIDAKRASAAKLAAYSTIDLSLTQDAQTTVMPQDKDWAKQSWAQATGSSGEAFRVTAGGVMWLVAFSPFWIPVAVAAWFGRKKLAKVARMKFPKAPPVQPTANDQSVRASFKNLT